MGPPVMVVVGSLITLAVCGAVLALGRTPERQAAALVLVGLAVALALQATLGFRRQLPILLTDIGLTAGFIVLAYRHRRAWLAIISLVGIALLVVHASLADSPLASPRFAMAVNGLNFLALGVLAGGALTEARHRHHRPTLRRAGA